MIWNQEAVLLRYLVSARLTKMPPGVSRIGRVGFGACRDDKSHDLVMNAADRYPENGPRSQITRSAAKPFSRQ